jgi:hypothetical protein
MCLLTADPFSTSRLLSLPRTAPLYTLTPPTCPCTRAFLTNRGHQTVSSFGADAPRRALRSGGGRGSVLVILSVPPPAVAIYSLRSLNLRSPLRPWENASVPQHTAHVLLSTYALLQCYSGGEIFSHQVSCVVLLSILWHCHIHPSKRLRMYILVTY